jgi:hypothetical protein
MLRIVIIATIVAALATGPVVAQQALQRPAVGLVGGVPVFTPDGEVAGRLFNLGRDGHGQGVLIAELDRPLGIGPQIVAIPIDMFVQRPDRIELSVTAEQLRDRIAASDRTSKQ